VGGGIICLGPPLPAASSGTGNSARRPSESSVSLLGRAASPPRAVLFWNRLSVQSFSPVAYRRHGFRRSRFAVGPVLGCAVFRDPVGPATVKQPVHPLFGFCLPLEFCPTMPSQSAAAERRLSWTFAPYSTSGFGGPLAAGFACPLSCAFRVWLPSWRLTPSEPLPVLFHTGGAHGIHPSEHYPYGRFAGSFPTGGARIPLGLRVAPAARSGGPA
jgi:hypothetical protein